jgi:hypothetical protein
VTGLEIKDCGFELTNPYMKLETPKPETLKLCLITINN